MRLELETRRFYLGRDYSEALAGCGAVPLHIALIPNREYIDAAIHGLDGILLPGSDSDMDPAYYGECPHPKLGRVVPEKDETDLMVLSACERHNIPVLSICFGMQALNVSRGGSLIQDIGSQVDNCIKHEQGKPLDRNSHHIKVADTGILASLVDRTASESVKVNSHHHQAIRSIGENLEATAWTEDGIIECLQDRRPDRVALAVQWHPELSWNTDPLSRNIFCWFVSRCADRANMQLEANQSESRPS